MMMTLLMEPGQLVHVKSTSLPLGSFVKLQPQSVDFLDNTDPKAVRFIRSPLAGETICLLGRNVKGP